MVRCFMEKEIITIDELKKKIYSYNKRNWPIIEKAYNYASKFHYGQKRESGEEYITHPLSVAYILASMHADSDTICAALLHDTIEDTESTYDDIKEQYAVLIENALKEATANHNRSIKAMERVADKCTETAKKAQESNDKLCRVDNFWKFLNFTAPIYVIADIVIRIFMR